ncbi:GNAT family N-acetyltransferase [Streptomyces orinoci]|uniref:GNAT family N-acetyltransferase n=1 Tax=Streptomyces orinoci TaxID=67339 RepID=A0ABV3JUW0_STRON|nr:GNAT family N-acetyltransferase [Streptomyces orinoci]
MPPTAVRHEALLTEIHTDIDGIDRDRWDALERPSVYLRYDWLRGRSRTVKGEPRFVTVSDTGGRLLLAAPAYLTGDGAHPAYDLAKVLSMEELEEDDLTGLPEARQSLTRLRADAAPWRPAIVAGSPGRMGGVAYARELDGAGRRRVATAAVEALERRADADGAARVAWLYLLEQYDPAIEAALARRGYQHVVIGADAYIPIEFDDFEGYLAQFTSHRRLNIRKEIEAFDRAGISVAVHDADVLGPRLAELELRWRAKYGRAADLGDTVAGYQSLRENIGDALRVVVASRHGEPIGFVVFLADPEAWWARFGGFDYSDKKSFLYFNLVFYRPVQLAIERGVGAIGYSMGSYEAKHTRGARLRHFMGYLSGVAPGSRAATDLAMVDGAQRRKFEAVTRHHVLRQEGS